MVLYVGLKYSTTVKGSRTVPVLCVKCAEYYFYRVECTAVGEAHAPYGLGMEAARQRAHDNAQRKLEQQLMRETLPVPCPRCGDYHKSMLNDLRSPRLQGMRYLGKTGLVVAAFATIISAFIFLFHLLVPPKEGFGALDFFLFLALIGGAIGMTALIYRSLSNAKYDPNDPATQRQRLEFAKRFTIPPEQSMNVMDKDGH